VKFARKTPGKLAVFYELFFSNNDLENSHEIPTKSPFFPANSSLEIP